NLPGQVLPGIGSPFGVEVEFVDSAEAAHAAVTVVPGKPAPKAGKPMDQQVWFVEAEKGAFSHELAHYLGKVHGHRNQLLRPVNGTSSGASGGHGGGGHEVLTEQALREIAQVALAHVATGGVQTAGHPAAATG